MPKKDVQATGHSNPWAKSIGFSFPRILTCLPKAGGIVTLPATTLEHTREGRATILEDRRNPRKNYQVKNGR